MAPNVEVNLRGLLKLVKRDLSVDEYLGQLGFSEAYSFHITVGLFLGTIVGYVSIQGQWSPARDLLRSSPGCSRPNMSFDMPASPEYLSSLARASLAE
ncbi:hypothetical protein Tco_1144757, partial [Tanacetum coccineum]